MKWKKIVLAVTLLLALKIGMPLHVVQSASYTLPVSYGPPQDIKITFDDELIFYANVFSFIVEYNLSDEMRDVQAAMQDGRCAAAGLEDMFLAIEGDYRIDSGKWASEMYDVDSYGINLHCFHPLDSDNVWKMNSGDFLQFFENGELPEASYFDNHTIYFRFRFTVGYMDSTGYHYDHSPWTPVVSYNNKSAGHSLYSNASSWAVPELDKAVQYELMTDRIKDNMKAPITRLEFCEVVVKLTEKITGSSMPFNRDENPFSDTVNIEVHKAYQSGIVKGIGQREFAPNNLVTRQEIAVMMMRAIRLCKPQYDFDTSGIPRFSDEASIASWALDAVRFMSKNGIIKGSGDGSIGPLENTTREQAVLLVVRTFEKFMD